MAPDPTPRYMAPVEAHPTARPPTRRTLAAVGLCAFALLYAFPYFPRINNPNENVRFYMTAALVEEGTYRIDEPRARWGWVNDAAVREGHYYSVKAPGTSLLGVPGYAAYRWLAGDGFDRTTALWVVRLTGTILPTLVFLFFFHRWLGERTRHPAVRDTVFLSVALGSLLLAYGYMFASHTTAAAVAFGAFMVLYDARHRGRLSSGGAFLAGLLAAGVTAFEYPGFFLSMLLCAYALSALRPWRRLVPFAAGALVPTVAVMHFHWSAFGHPLSPGHLFVENPAFRQNHEQGFFGASGFHPEAAWRLLFDFRIGLLVLTPVLVLAVPGFVRLLSRRSQRLDALVALGASVSLYVFICFMNIWDAGWAVGPRYLAPVVPFLAWGAVACLDAVADVTPRFAGAVGVGCAACGFVAAGVPSVYYPHLPPGLDWPLAHLLALLIQHDFAPMNAGNLLGWYGTASMLPLYLLAIFALGWAAWTYRRPATRAWVLGVGALVAAFLLLPHFRAPPADVPARRSIAFITRTWHPEGHDRAARLEERLAQERGSAPEDFRRLSELYRAEGRMREARAATRRANHGASSRLDHTLGD
ncbi:MAG: hypothetical protein ACODAU_06685 [Myxococcota bacterium]